MTANNLTNHTKTSNDDKKNSKNKTYAKIYAV